MSENLCATFHCDNIDQSELEHLLLMHFGGSQSLNDNEIRYVRGIGGDPALVLKYSKNGAVAEVVAGPSIGANDVSAIVEKIERHLLSGDGLHIGQLALFAILPTRGWFRYRDVFQLLPVPPDAPQAPFMTSDHPLLLQYEVKSSGDFQIDMLRRAQVGRELELLCTALTTTIRGGIGNVVRQHWSLVRGQDPTSLRSEYCQEAYRHTRTRVRTASRPHTQPSMESNRSPRPPRRRITQESGSALGRSWTYQTPSSSRSTCTSPCLVKTKSASSARASGSSSRSVLRLSRTPARSQRSSVPSSRSWVMRNPKGSASLAIAR
jgi:hypothetical protein